MAGKGKSHFGQGNQQKYVKDCRNLLRRTYWLIHFLPKFDLCGKSTLLPIILTPKINKNMEENKVELFIMIKGKYFRNYQLPEIRDRMKKADASTQAVIQTLDFKEPTIMLVVSILVGQLGIDRFMVGDTGLGILKLITCGGLGIWTIVDWFLIMGITKDKNMEKLQPFLY